jgi:hypothetical protein
MAREQRHGQRVRAYLPVSLQPRDNPRALQTLTKDVSVEGLRCLSPMPVPVSTELRVQLTLGVGNEPLLLRGRTQWFRSLPYSEQFELGLTFLEVSPETVRRLSTYLDHLATLPQPATVGV